MTPVTADQRLPLVPFILSFVIALVLTVLPLPKVLVWLNPSWVLLVLMYWVLIRPQQCNIGVSFFWGVLLDLLNGNVVGQYALIFVVISYFLARFQQRIILFFVGQQVLVVIGMCFLEKIGVYIIQATVDQAPYSLLFWGAPFVSGLVALCFSLVRGGLYSA